MSYGLDGYLATQQLDTGEESVPRMLAQSVAAISSGQMRLGFFTARRTESVTQLRLVSIGAAGATPTLVRAGVYTVDAAGNGTLATSIANDTSLFAGTNSQYTRTLTAPLAKVAKKRYAIGIVVVTAAAAPTVPTCPVLNGNGAGETGASPRLAGSLAGLGDLPASFTAASLVGSASQMPYLVLLP